MTRFRASAFALIGVAALLAATAAEGQSAMSGSVVRAGRMGHSMGMGKGGVIGHGGMHRHAHDFRHGHFGRGRHDFRPFWRSRVGDFGFGFGLYGYGGYLAGDYDAYRDSDFFMAYPGPRTAIVDGRVVYDYDRGYPYDYYRGDGRGAGGGYAVRAQRCTVEWGWDAHERRDVPIRICRR